MTREEWKAIADEVASLWGKSAKWVHAIDAYRFAAHVPAGAAHQAVEQVFLENRKYAPAPADILAAAKMFTAPPVEGDVVAYCTQSGTHLWGIVGEQAGVRTVICARCKRTEERSARTVPTDGEVEDGVFSGSDPTERIAP